MTIRYEFIVTSVRNDESIYNQPYYLITDGEKVYLFEQEVWQVAYPATANIFEKELILTYVKSQQGDGPDCYVGTYALKDGVYVQKSEKKVSNGIDTLEGTGMVVGKLVDGEYKLYKIRRDKETDFPITMRDLWVLGEEYNLQK